MPKYSIHAIYTASKCIGEVEANSEAEAVDKAKEGEFENEEMVILCHQCAGEIELNETPYDFQADEIPQPPQGE